MAPKSQLCACSFQDSLRQKNWALEQIRKFPDTIGQVQTAENDSNTLRLDAKIFASAKKYLRKKKFPDTCGHGLSQANCRNFSCSSIKQESENIKNILFQPRSQAGPLLLIRVPGDQGEGLRHEVNLLLSRIQYQKKRKFETSLYIFKVLKKILQGKLFRIFFSLQLKMTNMILPL